ncbi:hypothetical protein M422DRAFT_22880 [Sphaerobolus stellatus SS14]|nr:hypothetical protein M422DRAFT_22880 [Sphaerobolus stellatus SS14]
MSFKRKGQPQITQLPGTRTSRLASSVFNISSGVPSLDDILGAGVPLGSVQVVLAPDPHAAYADILQRYFVAQGIASGQRVCILDDGASDLAASCMWISKSVLEDAEESQSGDSGGVKIAWRYEKMKQFQTSVRMNESSQDNFCHPFDLTTRISDDTLNSALSSQQLRYVPVSGSDGSSISNILSRLDAVLAESTQDKNFPVRVSIPDLGSPQWGDLTPINILRVLHHLRARARQNSEASRVCFFVTLPSYISQESWGGPGWSEKLGWLSDGCITLRSFSSDPSLTSLFPSHHGLIDTHTLPALQTLVPPSDRLSELRGLSSTSSSAIGGGENNLAFKCTRKRFIIETLHLDVEGGVSERRTTAPVVPDGSLPKPVPRQASSPVIEISVVEDNQSTVPTPTEVKKKPKKSVAFQSDRPDLYDF